MSNYMNYGYNPYGSAFGNYGYGYTPSPYYANPYQQAQQTQQTQPQTQAQTQSTIQQPLTNTNEIFVSGVDDVKARLTPINSSYMFLDNDKALLYEKIVDGKGKYEIKTYEIKELNAQESPKNTSSINSSNFAKTTDVDALRQELEGLKDKVAKLSVQKQINDLKKE